jgi:hypothetical protein
MPDLKVALARLPKNLKSNRFWEIAGGRAYLKVSQRRAVLLLPRLGIEGDSSRGIELYLVWYRFFLAGKKKKLSVAVLVRELGMFGNMTRRLAKSISLCLSKDLDGVLVPAQSIFSRQWFEEGSSSISARSTLWLGSDSESDFRRANIDALAVKDFFYGSGDDRLFHPRTSSITWSHLASLLRLKKPTVGLGDDVLTLHVRGGDVFGNRQPAQYGQPPLAFYLLVLGLKKWKKVVLVYQDSSNPVVEGIIEYCKSRKVSLDKQSSTDTEDVSLLLSATNLAGARGTFIPAITGLSEHLRTVYYFEDKFSVTPRKEGVTIHRVIDVDGTYRREVLSGNWENSTFQQELMMNYPTSCLAVSTGKLGD